MGENNANGKSGRVHIAVTCQVRISAAGDGATKRTAFAGRGPRPGVTACRKLARLEAETLGPQRGALILRSFAGSR